MLKPLSACATGLYLASAGQDRQLLVWDMLGKSIIAQRSTGAVLSALSWRPEPGANALAGIGEDGQIRLYRGIIPDDMRGPAASQQDAAPSLARSTQDDAEGADDYAGMLSLKCIAFRCFKNSHSHDAHF